MTTFTIRMPDDQADRLRAMAKHRGISVNKLMEELSTRALSEFDSETRFRLYASNANPQEALAVLEKLDKTFGIPPPGKTG
jgi:hypothetical protein